MGKHIFTLIAIALFSSIFHVKAQQDQCATMDVLEHQMAKDPSIAVRMEKLERSVQDWISKNKISRNADEIYTIPVVVHIVYQDSTENISDEVIFEQFEILNQDYRKMNADAANVRDIFQDRIADVGIEFQLAQRDPEGNPTTGITRTEGEPKILGFPLFNFFDPLTNNIKSEEGGGKSPWPVDQYLNIWVGNISAESLGLLGYAQLPQSYMDPDSVPAQAVETDGVVVDYRAFGTTGDYLLTTDGRTLTHEVGHWLGLRHVWGDGDCTKDDFVLDTPVTDGAAQECDFTRNSCVDSLNIDLDEVDMLENFMDYALGCASAFTVGQKERMLGYLLNDSMRVSLLTSDALLPPVTSIDNRKNNISWDVFPNPTKGILQLRWETARSTEASVDILDVQGRTIFTEKSFQPSLSIDMSQFTTGVYMIRLRTEEGQSVKKVVVE